MSEKEIGSAVGDQATGVASDNGTAAAATSVPAEQLAANLPAKVEAASLPVAFDEASLPEPLSLDLSRIRVAKERRTARRCTLALFVCLVMSLGISFQAILIWVSLGLVASGILEQRFKGSAILTGVEQFPHVYEATRRSCRLLSVTDVVETYVTNNPGGLDVYTLKLRGKYAIVLNADWVAMMTPDELSFVIAREIAHIRAGHLKRLSLINVLRSAPPFLRLLAAPLELYRYIYSPWSRYAAMTADRLALEATALDLDAAVSALAKIAAGEELAYAVNPKAFVAQAEALKFDAYLLLNELVAGGPLPVRRVKMLEDYLRNRPKEGYPAVRRDLIARFFDWLLSLVGIQ